MLNENYMRLQIYIDHLFETEKTLININYELLRPVLLNTKFKHYH